MTPAEYLTALYATGIPTDLPVLELDRRAAELLETTKRSTRRYRTGVTPIPGPVRVALLARAQPE